MPDELDNFIARHEADKKTWGPVKRWLKSKGYLGYNGWYWATNPHKLVPDTYKYIKGSIKHFIQRGRRGYSDSDLWNFDGYLSKMLPAAFIQMRDTHYGYPPALQPEEWDDILTELAEGFREYHDLYMSTLTELGQEDNEKWERTVRLFGRWYGHFWD